MQSSDFSITKTLIECYLKMSIGHIKFTIN